MNLFSYFIPSLILISASTISLGLSTLPLDEQNRSTKPPQSKLYKVHFLSLKKGHKIASSYFDFKQQHKFEINIPGEEFLKTKGNYTKNSLQFKANWEGNIIKQRKRYCYTFNIMGISLLDTYIAGIIRLNESIKETHQDQKVTFLFIGTLKEDNSSESKKRGLFPF
ncbi:MAG: hypothetical protein AMJ42_03670 [Deltaproteobacteria bacterium DG_8]|nr:MAG: hypothetical protein AMJ42_03670 [Deltaproteobacteria bacterium DG_8]